MGQVIYLHEQHGSSHEMGDAERTRIVGRCSIKMMDLPLHHFNSVVHHIEDPEAWEAAFQALHAELAKPTRSSAPQAPRFGPSSR